METRDLHKFHLYNVPLLQTYILFSALFYFWLKKIHLVAAKIWIGTSVHLSPSPALRHPYDSVTILQSQVHLCSSWPMLLWKVTDGDPSLCTGFNEGIKNGIPSFTCHWVSSREGKNVVVLMMYSKVAFNSQIFMNRTTVVSISWKSHQRGEEKWHIFTLTFGYSETTTHCVHGSLSIT